MQTGPSERQTLWPPLGYLEAAVTVLFVLFYVVLFLTVIVFSHSSAAFHVEFFRYIFLCTLFLKVRFSLIPRTPLLPPPPNYLLT